MSQYTATVQWSRKNQIFTDMKYSRGHTWQFDGGLTVPASSSPHIVPLPFSIAANIDPEEAFIAALSSCHMLFFLSIAAKKGLIIEDYTDQAVGLLEKSESGQQAMTEVTLNPRVICGESTTMTKDEQHAIHQKAHKLCFIANSVKTRIHINLA